MSTVNNSVQLTGNLVRDLDLRFTNTGTPVANGRIAATDRYTDSNGDRQDRTAFINFVVWGDMALHAAASLTKGAHISIRGRLQTREYETEGQRRYVTEVVATDVAPSLRWAAVTIEREPVPVGADDRGDAVYGDESEPF